jgi:ferredoxin
MVLHKIALNFEDGTTRFIDADESESIADAAYRQGINVPLDCTNGVCGTCKAFRQSGEFDPGSYDALSDAEAAEGYVLCCQAKAKSDMVIEILASSDACKVRTKDTMAEIVEVRALSAHRIRLSVQPLEGALPMFMPGQYVSVTAPNTTAKRPYSFTSAPGADVATFLIHNLPGGKMSAYLEAKPRRVTGSFSTARSVVSTFVPRAGRSCSLPEGPALGRSCQCSSIWLRGVPTISPFNSFTASAMTPIWSRWNGSRRLERASRGSPLTPPVRTLEAGIR